MPTAFSMLLSPRAQYLSMELSEKCLECGICCKYPLILPSERKAISKSLGLFRRRLLKRQGPFYRIESDPCPFLKRSGSKRECEIYEKRPLSCRIFPLVIIPETLKWTVSDECPLKPTESYMERARRLGKRMMETHKKINAR